MAFVLEGVRGVRGVFAVAPRAGVDDEVTLIVHVEGDKRCIAAAHYALLKIIKHEDCRRVAIVEALPATFEHRTTEISLSPSARFVAMSRVSARVKALAEERAAILEAEKNLVVPVKGRDSSIETVLVFSKDPSLGELARQAFPLAIVQTIREFGAAVKTAKYGHHGLVLCPLEVAFGVWGFLECVSEHRPALAEEVVVVADKRDRDVFVMGLTAWKRTNRCLWQPVTVESLRQVSRAPLGSEGFSVVAQPVASQAVVVPAAGPPSEPAPHVTSARSMRSPGPKPIVLLVDDEPDTESLPAAMSPSVHVIRVSSEWDALDKLALSEIDLIVCNASMKVAGDKPLYRVLWNVRPELKKVCTLIISPHRVPASARDGRTKGAITRPVTSDIIKELLAARA